LEKIRIPELKPSNITLREYDGCPSTLVGLYPSVPVKLVGKTMLIEIEVLNTQLDYNILLDQSYMYKMITITSSVFRIMMFPHEGNNITIDQLTYHEKTTSPTPNGVFPLVS